MCKEFVSKFGNVRAGNELVNNIVNSMFHNPDSDLYVGDPGVKPSIEDQMFSPEVYGDITEYQREGIRQSSGVYVTPQWCRTQDWYKQLWADAKGIEYEDVDDLDEIPEDEYDLVPYPNLVFCAAEYSNIGWYWLFTVSDGEVESYNPDGGVEYGASGGAYTGCYSEEDTVEITKWCEDVLSEIEDGNLFL